MASNLLACISMVVIWRFHKRQLAQEAAAEAQAQLEEPRYESAVEDEKLKVDEATTQVSEVRK